MFDAYRRIGLDPLYVVDSRSVDGTVDVLREKGAKHVLFTPHGDFAEAGMIEFGSRSVGATWALRLDDDEFPSRALVEWMESGAFDVDRSAWFISRREVSLVDGRFAYSRWPTRYGWHGRYDVLNPQLRLYRVDDVRYTERLHSAGFEPPGKVDCAPNQRFVIHCNNILRSAEERLEKVRKYAQVDEKTAWRVVDECLPELTSAAAHDFCFDGLDEFTELFAALPIVLDSPAPSLSNRELSLIMLSTQEWLADSAHVAQKQIRYERTRASWSSFLASKGRKRIVAELVMSLGRMARSATLVSYGNHLWREYEAARNHCDD